MNRRLLPFVLALALATAPAAALANDFYQPSPVPSSRDNIKPVKDKKLPTSWQNAKTSSKIVKTTKQTPAQTPTPASIQ